MADYRYKGDELALFTHRHDWKDYWISRLAPFVKGDIVEVGAGIGSNTVKLRHLSTGRWLCLEPDELLLSELQGKVGTSLSLSVEVICGTVSFLPKERIFDTALYINVLDHIADDMGEIMAVTEHIRKGGHIIVLSPAHQLLYSPFDRAIGHQRRYDHGSLLRCMPPNAHPVVVNYLDSACYLLSRANRLVLQQSSPTLKQILFWDKYILPVSRLLDPLLGFRFGKSIFGVWQMRGNRRI